MCISVSHVSHKDFGWSQATGLTVLAVLWPIEANPFHRNYQSRAWSCTLYNAVIYRQWQKCYFNTTVASALSGYHTCCLLIKFFIKGYYLLLFRLNLWINFFVCKDLLSIDIQNTGGMKTMTDSQKVFLFIKFSCKSFFCIEYQIE